MRARDLDRLAAEAYDVVIIGGGVHGLATAYDGASRGLRTALVEAQDFGSGTSFNHQKTIHGGLRLLQTGRIDRARASILERRAFARIAPWLLRPQPFIVGTYRSITRGRTVLRAAFRVDRWLGRRRNEGVEPELHLPAARLVSKAATLRLFPGVRQEGLTGGAQWYDYQMVEADRLTFAFASAADRAGANLVNYVEAVGVVRDAGRVAGVRVRDVLTGATTELRTRAVVNAAGARAGDVMALFGITRPFPLLKAMSLVTSKRASDMALAAPASDGRMLTLVPWRGCALVGTSQSASPVAADDITVSAAEVDQFIATVNRTFPQLQISASDVTLVHRGLLPAVVDGQGRPQLRSESSILNHANEGAAGAFTIFGAKYTMARRVAERTTNAIARATGKRVPASRTATTVLPGAGIADHEALAIETARGVGLELPLATIRHLNGRYAERAADIIRIIHARPELLAPVDSARPTLQAEIVYTIQHEMAIRLTDVVIRRTGLGAAGHPGPQAIEACAALAARELGWDDDRRRQEVDAVNDFYRIR
jgi:glycerol-3-phosphate dehydrogenase